MKKLVAVTMILLMSISGLAGCSSDSTKNLNEKEGTKIVTEKEQKNPETVVLRMWGGVPPEAGPQEVIDNFNAEFKDKGIQAEYERFVNDDTGNLKLETSLLVGNEVDIYVSYTLSTISKRANGNMALDLSSFIERDKFNLVEKFGGLAESYYVDGKPYSVPTKLDQYGIVLNKTMFEKAGIPIPKEWTYDEFREISKKLTHGEGQDKVYGMFFNTAQNVLGPVSYFASQTLGGDYLYTNENESKFTDPTIVKTYELVNNMMNVDKTAPTHIDNVTQKLSQEGMFLSEKSAMTIGAWMVRSIKDTEKYPHDFVTAFAPFPIVEAGQRNFVQGALGDNLSINPKSKNQEEAWTFIKWYAEGGMLPLTKGGRIPAYKNIDQDEVARLFLEGGENILDEATAKDILIIPKENYAVDKITNKLPELNKILTEEAESFLSGKTTVEEGLATAKVRGDEVLKK